MIISHQTVHRASEHVPVSVECPKGREGYFMDVQPQPGLGFEGVLTGNYAGF